jgi:hypothetical protein
MANNGKVHLRDEPELIAGSALIPTPDSIVKRRGTNYRVTSVFMTNAQERIPRYIVNLVPIDEFPPD